MEARTQRALTLFLCLWVAGVQITEAIAEVGVAGCAILGLYAFVTRGRSAWKPALKAFAPVLCLVAWSLVAGSLVGRFPKASAAARICDWLLIPLAIWAIAQLGPTRRLWVARVGGAVLLLSCGAALAQHLGLWPKAGFFSGVSWTGLSFNRVYEQAPGTDGRYMAGGLLFHRLKFAHVTGLLAIAAFGWGIGPMPEGRGLARACAFCGFGSVVAFSYARAAAVAVALAFLLVVALLLRRGPRRWTTLWVVGAAAGLLVFIPGSWQRLRGSLEVEGSGGRRYLVEAGLNAAFSHPIVGVGLGRFRAASFASPSAPSWVIEHTGKAHNQLVTFAAETGFPGAIAFILVLAWLGRASWRAGPGTARAVGLGVLLYFVLLCGLHDPLFHPELSIAWMLVIGASISRRELEPAPPAHAPDRP